MKLLKLPAKSITNTVFTKKAAQVNRQFLVQWLLGIPKPREMLVHVPLTVRIKQLRAERGPGPGHRALQRDELTAFCPILTHPHTHAPGKASRLCWFPEHLMKQDAQSPGPKRHQHCGQRKECSSQKSSNNPLQSHPQRPVGVHQYRSRFSTEDAIGGSHAHHPKGWAENQVAGRRLPFAPNWQSVHGRRFTGFWDDEEDKKILHGAHNASEDCLSDS